MIQIKTKNILDCFTCVELVYEYSKVQYLNKKVNGFYIPTWKDFTITNKQYYVETKNFILPELNSRLSLNSNNIIKIRSPWIMKTVKPCYFYLIGGSVFKNKNFGNLISNIHNYKNYFNPYIDIQICHNIESCVFIEFSKPFAYGISFSNENFQIKNHLISEKEYIEMEKESEKNKNEIEFTQLMDEFINESKTN